MQDMKPHGAFIKGDVAELTDTSAKLHDGRVLDFDVAVVATGSSYAVGKATAATSTQDRKAELQVCFALAVASALDISGGC
jgi:ATP-dependent protease HslVU (ClpYQ) peptidase subunit